MSAKIEKMKAKLVRVDEQDDEEFQEMVGGVGTLALRPGRGVCWFVSDYGDVNMLKSRSVRRDRTIKIWTTLGNIFTFEVLA